MYDKVRPLVERSTVLSSGARSGIGAGVALLYVAWQSLLMDPLTGAREQQSSTSRTRAAR